MIKVNGQNYSTISEAASVLGVKASTMRNWKQEALRRDSKKIVKKINIVMEVKQ